VNRKSNPELLIYSDICDILTTISIMVMLIFFRISQRNLNKEIDELNCTPSDFTIVVYNIPLGLDDNYIENLKNVFIKALDLNSELDEFTS
jgi:hypothetical protein